MCKVMCKQSDKIKIQCKVEMDERNGRSRKVQSIGMGKLFKMILLVKIVNMIVKIVMILSILFIIMMSRLKNSRIWIYLRSISQQLENQKLNRQQVGEDRNGNKYYQYYSYYGLPTRREIQFKEKGNFDLEDLVYHRWLYKFDFQPPTQQEKQKFYLQEKLRYERALQWDSKEEKLMIEFRKKRQELLLRDKALNELQKELQSKSELDIKTKRPQ